MFKRIGFIAALFVIATSALAQTNVPPPAPAEIASPFVSPWTGIYLGGGVSATRTDLNFRGGSSTISLSDTTAPGVATFLTHPPLDHRLYSDGTFLTLGVRLQLSQFVLGMDIDRDFGARKTMAAGPNQLDGVFGVFTTGNFVNVGLNSFGGFELLGHTRGVFGVAVSPTVMLFGTAGVAHARFYTTGVSASGFVASSPSAPLTGETTVTQPPGEKHGPSLGFGMDVKVTDNIIARLEYIRDSFNIPTMASAGFGGTIGELTTNNNISAGNPQYVINTIRGSLNYRFGPEDKSAQVASLTSKDAYGKWSGFYFGGGAAYGHNKTSTDGLETITIFDNSNSTTPFQLRERPSRTGDESFGHLLAGYLWQYQRLVFGLEYDRDFTDFNYHRTSFNPGAITGTNFASSQGAQFCGTFVSGSFTCLGGQMFGAYTPKDRIRAIVGYEVLPKLLVFGAAGISRGKAAIDSVTMTGTVSASPSAPLVGASTSSRFQEKTVTGSSYGGGVQFKVLDQLSLRVEFLRDFAKWGFKPFTGAGFGGTIGNQTTNSFISPGQNEEFETNYWRASAIVQF